MTGPNQTNGPHETIRPDESASATSPRDPTAPPQSYSRPPEQLTSLAPPAPPQYCIAAPGLIDARATRRVLAPLQPDAQLAADPLRFGLALAEAAVAQTRNLVIYNATYMSISYPRGDVPAQFGVCTDVVIRAYRALDIDLQELVHESRSGASDPNIDHRRTEMLRHFFAAQGEPRAITPFSEDYLPGDIVTYYRPQNRSSTSHIAVVTGEIAPSGRPMIAHNRGWGVQLEDALFVDQMTGHYRYRGPGQPLAVAAKARPDRAVSGLLPPTPVTAGLTRISATHPTPLTEPGSEPLRMLARLHTGPKLRPPH